MRLNGRVVSAVAATVLAASCGAMEDSNSRATESPSGSTARLMRVNLSAFSGLDAHRGASFGTNRFPLVKSWRPGDPSDGVPVAEVAAGDLKVLPPIPTGMFVYTSQSASDPGGVLVSLYGCSDELQEGDATDFDCFGTPQYELWRFSGAKWGSAGKPHDLLQIVSVVDNVAVLEDNKFSRWSVDLAAAGRDLRPLASETPEGGGRCGGGPAGVQIEDGGATVVWKSSTGEERRTELGRPIPSVPLYGAVPAGITYRCEVFGRFLTIPGKYDLEDLAIEPTQGTPPGVEIGLQPGYTTLPPVDEPDAGDGQSETRYAVVDLAGPSAAEDYFSETADVETIFGGDDFWGWVDSAGVHVSRGGSKSADILDVDLDRGGFIRAARDGIYIFNSDSPGTGLTVDFLGMSS